MIITLLSILASISTEDIRRELPVSPPDAAIVRDAIARHVEKGGTEGAVMRNRVPIVVHMPPKRCVMLKVRASSVGASPVYCYDQNNVMIEYYSGDQ